jgi:hypothetical protein
MEQGVPAEEWQHYEPGRHSGGAGVGFSLVPTVRPVVG